MHHNSSSWFQPGAPNVPHCCRCRLQNKELLHAKSVLCTNISSLYTTAKLEIQRKSDEIQELRDK